MNVHDLSHFCASVWNLYLCSLSKFLLILKVSAQLPIILWNHFILCRRRPFLCSHSIQYIHVKVSICKPQNPLWLFQAERDLLKDIGWLMEFGGGIENQLNTTKLEVTARKEPNHISCLRQETELLLLLLSTDHPLKTWGYKHGYS